MAETWQEKQAAHPDPVATALSRLGLGSEWRERLLDAIDAHEEATRICCECDEPGCTEPSTCGFPVAGGYRRTCGNHYWPKLGKKG